MMSDIVLLNQNWNNTEEALLKFGKYFIESGFAKESFTNALLEREKSFPTGLQFSDYGVAIPHTDPEYVTQTAIGIATLKEPIQFIQMGTSDQVVNVKLIIMLAIKEAHSQVEMLQKLMALLQDENIVRKLMQFSVGEEKKIEDLLKKNNIL